MKRMNTVKRKMKVQKKRKEKQGAKNLKIDDERANKKKEQ